MRLARPAVIAVVSGLLFACSSGNPQQLLETAQFEEKQNNREHATKLYQEIIAKHGNSSQAKLAQERLQALK